MVLKNLLDMIYSGKKQTKTISFRLFNCKVNQNRHFLMINCQIFFNFAEKSKIDNEDYNYRRW